MATFQKATLIKVIDETSSIKRFFFEVMDQSTFDFQPGQFVTLDLPIHEKAPKRLRSYSIASAPNGTNTFELVIVLVEDGLGTPWLFNHLKIGDSLPFRGPLGKFLLPSPIDTDICFICTGTGIAPFRSMIQFITENKVPCQNLYLIFGTRYYSDVLYGPEFFDLSKKVKQLHYYPCLSREHDIVEGYYKGYVHPVYENLFSDKRPARFYLCGWRDMIEESRSRIVDLGYDRKGIHVEIYG